MMNIRLSCAAMPAAVLLTIALSSGAVAAVPHKVIDKRLQTDADGVEREISLCARLSPDKDKPGHAFVAFSSKPANGPRSFFAIGHTPNAPAAAAILTYKGVFSVSGRLDEEKYTSTKERCLVLQVNKAQYESALAEAKHDWPKDTPLLLRYSLGEEDCMGFMMRVAKLLGLSVPTRGALEFPLQYQRRLIDAN